MSADDEKPAVHKTYTVAITVAAYEGNHPTAEQFAQIVNEVLSEDFYFGGLIDGEINEEGLVLHEVVAR